MNAFAPLLTFLSRWPGRRRLERRLEALGYQQHKEYRKLLIRNCNECNPESLEKYWDEVAHESVTSAGRADSSRRHFSIAGSYRSQYLDQLFSVPTNAEQGRLGKPLDAGLRSFYEKSIVPIEAGVSLNTKILEIIEKSKSTEAISKNFLTIGEWNDLSSLSEALGAVASHRNFTWKKMWWRKSITDLVEKRCRIDKGRKNSWEFLLPVETQIGMIRDPPVFWDLSAVHRIVPGFHVYQHYRGSQSGMLGLSASVDYLDAMGDLLQPE